MTEHEAYMQGFNDERIGIPMPKDHMCMTAYLVGRKDVRQDAEGKRVPSLDRVVPYMGCDDDVLPVVPDTGKFHGVQDPKEKRAPSGDQSSLLSTNGDNPTSA